MKPFHPSKEQQENTQEALNNSNRTANQNNLSSKFNPDDWERMKFNSRPHEVFNLDWMSYSSKDFANTFLPYSKVLKGEAISCFDGGELFSNVSANSSKNESMFKLVNYTYPKGVLAEERKDRIKVKADEICTFFELDELSSLRIYFRFGENFRKKLEIHIANSINISAGLHLLEEEIYITDVDNLKKYFNNGLTHQRMMDFTLSTLGVEDLSLTIPTTEYNGYSGEEPKGTTQRDLKSIFIYTMDKHHLADLLERRLQSKYSEIFHERYVYDLEGWKSKLEEDFKGTKSYLDSIETEEDCTNPNPSSSPSGSQTTFLKKMNIKFIKCFYSGTNRYPTVDEYLEEYEKAKDSFFRMLYAKSEINPKFYPYILSIHAVLLDIMIPLILSDSDIEKLKDEESEVIGSVNGTKVLYLDIMKFYIILEILDISKNFSDSADCVHYYVDSYYKNMFNKQYRKILHPKENKCQVLVTKKGKEVETDVLLHHVSSSYINLDIDTYSSKDVFYEKFYDSFVIIDEIATLNSDGTYELKKDNEIASKIINSSEGHKNNSKKKLKNRGVKIIITQRDEGQRSSAEKNGMLAYINERDFYLPEIDCIQKNSKDPNLVWTMNHEVGHLFGLDDRYVDLLCYEYDEVNKCYSLDDIRYPSPRAIHNENDILAMRSWAVLNNLMYIGDYLTEYQAKIILGIAGEKEDIDVEPNYPYQKTIVPCNEPRAINNISLTVDLKPEHSRLMLSLDDKGELVFLHNRPNKRN